MSVGANVVGAQIAYSFNPSWRGEVRHVTGKQSADAGTIKTQVNGVRAYRLFGGGKTRFYLGGEADYVAGTQDHSAYRSTGQGPGDLSVWRGA